MSVTAPAARVAKKAAAHRCRIIVMSSPKGGTGKTTFTQNLLPLFAQEGLSVVGVDLDPQRTLSKWFARREAAADRKANLPMFDVLPTEIANWQKVLAAVQPYDVAIIDMLPSVDDCIAEVHGLCEAADLVVVTTGATMSDLDATGPWVAELNRLGFKVATFMNRANRREVFFEAARGQLNKLGALCPVEVRNLSDAHSHSVEGLAAVDKPKAKSRADFTNVWHYVRRQVGL
ncbi:ParA family protein [Roseomonas sp. KE2513]|uniref:ParA family protein n=1 Tax=Roseomonas sp. KE2513 TaxID=2479202 RepID=UPI0018DEF945|nr:ParA family protein [Roseomonas sp. KE2513]MBI0538224.1 ParA family protein [Roseomonas sp. KE2513]